MLRSLERHPQARAIFAGQQLIEAPLTWDHPTPGIPCRSLLDSVCINGRCPLIADLKSAASVEVSDFSKRVFDYGYHRQAAFYIEAAKAVWDEELPFAFVVVQKTPPYTCEVLELDAEYLELGHRENEEALSALLRCSETGDWHKPGWSDVKTVPMPYWAGKQKEWQYEPAEER